MRVQGYDINGRSTVVEIESATYDKAAGTIEFVTISGKTLFGIIPNINDNLVTTALNVLLREGFISFTNMSMTIRELNASKTILDKLAEVETEPVEDTVAKKEQAEVLGQKLIDIVRNNSEAAVTDLVDFANAVTRMIYVESTRRDSYSTMALEDSMQSLINPEYLLEAQSVLFKFLAV